MLGVCVCYFQVSSLKKNNTKQPLFIFFIFLSFGMVSGIQPSDFVFSFLPSQQAKLCRGNTRQRMQDLLGARAQQSLFSLPFLFPAAWPDKTGDEQVSCFVFTNI